VLYDAPVVQDMGLFLRGFERTDNGNENQTIPYHKRKLLGLTKKLYIVHASSSATLGPYYMGTRAKAGYTTDLEACKADPLGTRDLLSWIATRQLSIKFSFRGVFSNLKLVSFGTWDAGRWTVYGKAVVRLYPRDVALLEVGACPKPRLEVLMSRVLSGTRNFSTLIEIDSNFGKEGILTVIHNTELHTIRPYKKTRVYVTTDALQGKFRSDALRGRGSTLTVGGLELGYDIGMKPVFRLPTPPPDPDSDSEDDFDRVSNIGLSAINLFSSTRRAHPLGVVPPAFLERDLEICLRPRITGDEGQLQLARDVRDALTRFEEASREKDGTNGYRGILKILVDDEIPACPCCGAKK
jgi:hypothetical protein